MRSPSPEVAAAITRARMKLVEGMELTRGRTLEGGCGVIGTISSDRVPGRTIIRSCAQMRNRGNGKGGGVAAAGLFDDHRQHYALHVAYLDEGVRQELEREWIDPVFEVAQVQRQPNLDDYRDAGLEVCPPVVWRYFVRARSGPLERFAADHGITDQDAAEDELVYQNSFRINRQHYAGQQNPRAFVLSHGRDLMILKGVGYAEEIARYYCLEQQRAHVWIGHQRYPTRGRVWHPGGAHPFAGLHEALVHNGDIANYHAITEYVRQWGMVPQFVTDTEVSVLLFDLYTRVLGYPLEFVIEALAPTPDGDFQRLSKPRQRTYRALQTAHLHGSPDGPWFFIVARNEPGSGQPQLVGITDVSMLRPQVFALQTGHVSHGAIASEKQAIDAFFEEVSSDDARVPTVADRYWAARGGSFTDGGAFSFTLRGQPGERSLVVRDKFGSEITAATSGVTGAAREDSGGTLQRPFEPRLVRPGATPGAAPEPPTGHRPAARGAGAAAEANADQPAEVDAGTSREEATAIAWLMEDLQREDFASFSEGVERLTGEGGPGGWHTVLSALTFLRDDRRWRLTGQRHASLLTAIDAAVVRVLDDLPGPGRADERAALRLDQSWPWTSPPPGPDTAGARLVIDARGFRPEGREAVSRLLVEAHRSGWRETIVYGATGDRFIGCGLGPDTGDVRLEIYGSSGDYLGSGMDGAEINVHGDAQDQVGQIFKAGRIVIHGNVGQTFLYGAKGGEAFVRGSAAGRPLINAVGSIRAVINGTCLDYCAESFMAGKRLGGGFVIINGLAHGGRGELMGMEMKYPGNNLFSLASGGACYLNDPYATVSRTQLNGAKFVPFSQADWGLLLPYLRRNEQLFGISIRNDLLRVDGVLKWPKEVFRKVVATAETRGLDWSSLPP